MIRINTSLTGNTFYSYVKTPVETGNTYYLMVLNNNFLKDEKRFIIEDISTGATPNIFNIYITHDQSNEDVTTPTLYLDNWQGYNDYKIYYRNGLINSYYMDEDYLVAEGIMYIYNDYTCYEPTTGTTTINYTYNNLCDTGTTSTGQTYVTGTTESIGTGAPSGITGLSLWLRPEELSGYTDTSGITYWSDVSGRGKNAYVTWDNPTWDSTGGPVGGGAVKFSGVTSNPQFFTITDMGLSNGDDLTIYVVHKSITDKDSTLICSVYDCYGGFLCGANPNDNGSLRMKGHQNVYSTGAVTASGYLDGTWKLVKLEYNSDTDVYINSVASGEAVGTSILEDNYKTWYIGMSIPYSDYLYENTFFEGYISEIIVYNKILSASENTDITNYISDKYGI